MPTIPGTILATISDEELSALVAVECAGWQRELGTSPTYGGSNMPRGWWKPSMVFSVREPSFATDANAILQLLENESWSCERSHGRFWFVLFAKKYGDPDTRSTAPTFARASCFCLLKAKGWTVTDSP